MKAQERARLRELYQETAQGEWEYVEPKDAASLDPYDREGYFKGIPILPIPDTYMPEPAEARFIVAAHNALPALLDELDAMEREREWLRDQLKEAGRRLQEAGFPSLGGYYTSIGNGWIEMPQEAK